MPEKDKTNERRYSANHQLANILEQLLLVGESYKDNEMVAVWLERAVARKSTFSDTVTDGGIVSVNDRIRAVYGGRIKSSGEYTVLLGDGIRLLPGYIFFRQMPYKTGSMDNVFGEGDEIRYVHKVGAFEVTPRTMEVVSRTVKIDELNLLGIATEMEGRQLKMLDPSENRFLIKIGSRREPKH